MESFRVLVSDKLSETGLSVFRAAAPRIGLDYKPGQKREELLSIIGDYDALAVRSATTADAELIRAGKRLRVIGRAGIGVDNIDLAAASKRGIIVMNTPSGNVVTTAEHALSLMTSLARKIPQATASMKAGKWEKSKFEGRELYQKTLGIVGIGNIGKIVADRAQGLKMRVIAYDPYVTATKAKELGVELVSFEELLTRSDIVSLHVPLVDATRGLISAAAIEKMKRGALLINAARGGLADEAAVAAAVKSGRLGGAAFDVFAEEPPKPDNPLLGVDGIILTPHLGASTAEAQENVAIEVAHQIVDYLTTGAVRNAVNAPSVPAEVMAMVGPYVGLGRLLGSFAAQLHDGALRTVQAVYQGSVAELRVEPISAAILASVLGTRLGAGVNEVNAPVEAKERGIEMAEQKSSAAQDFVATVGVRLVGDGAETHVVGTLFGAGEARIVGVDGLRLEIPSEGHLLLTRHHDRPGVIGRIGTILGARSVNISRMVVGVAPGQAQSARAAITVDSPVPADAVSALEALEGIDEVRVIKLGGA